MLKSGCVASSVFLTQPLSLRKFEYLHDRNHVVASLISKNFNELLHQFLDQQGHDVVPNL